MSSSIKLAPNILIFTEDENEFNKFKLFLKSILGRDSYTIYRLKTIDLLNNSLWSSNCSLLITSESFNQNYLDEKCQVFKSYLNNGGKILSLPSISEEEMDRNDKNVQDSVKIHYHSNKYLFESKYDLDSCLTKQTWSDAPEKLDLFFYYYKTASSGIHFISKAYIDTENTFSDDFLKKIFSNLFEYFFKLNKTTSVNENENNFELYEIYSKNQLLQSKNVITSYLTDSMNKKSKFSLNTQSSNFDSNSYFNYLKTKKLGLIILYSDLVESTMNSINILPNSLDNLLVLARQQTQGQGNNKNEWLSPIGCCMFTLYLNLNSQQFSTSRLCLLQFVAALSCVKSIKNNPDLADLPIQIKWPNDIYFESKTKLGGVLVKSSILGSFINLKIGIGFNLNNQYPTECLNKILKENSKKEISNELFIANFLNEFEFYLNLLSKPDSEGLESFLNYFQEHWMHKHQKVRVKFWDEEVEIIGLNEYGYLKVKRLDNSIHCLQPDGNRFDLMNNLIVLR